MSSSPNLSPRSSPRPSPLIESKYEHKGEMHLSVNYKEKVVTVNAQKSDASPSPESATAIKIVETEANRSDSKDGKDPVKEKKNGKKKKAWYSALYPTYKSKSDDFKRYFKEVPDDERLVVDYSCALQKEILVHGRLYASQNFLCFYANIFGWETNVTIKWRDVAAITKEKTALVIPNAILITTTKLEKCFFTSFAARDKTYLMLFRIWQNALMDRQMSSQEMWQLVHQCYGSELGLTSDDDDYVNPSVDEKIGASTPSESVAEECTSTTLAEPLLTDSTEDKPLDIPTDLSDSTESDIEKSKGEVTCTSPHEGRLLATELLPINIDTLFTLLFTSSKFFVDFHASRKTTDLTQTAWAYDPATDRKTRVVNLTASLNASVGPKTAQVLENQVMLPCSKSGQLYAIDVETINGGIPYADSFYILVHWCLRRVADNQTAFSVYAQIKYKKSVWGLVKGFIEKNCYQGLVDFYACLIKALLIESEETIPMVKRKSRRRRRILSIHKPEIELDHPALTTLTLNPKISGNSAGLCSSEFATFILFSVLLLLVVLNVMLYYKLWSLEEAPLGPILHLHTLKEPPQTHQEWIELLQNQEAIHSVEMQRWQKVLKTSIRLLKQIEGTLSELQHSIHPVYTSKIATMVKESRDATTHEL